MNRRHFLRGGTLCAGAAAIERVTAKPAFSLNLPATFGGSLPAPGSLQIDLREAVVVVNPENYRWRRKPPQRS